MSFIEKNLASNEKVIHLAKLHWWVYVKSLLLIVVGAAINSSTSIGAFLIVIGLVGIVLTILARQSSEFAITNKRVIFKTGLFSRKVVELQLNKAEGMQVQQGFLGRIFNFGKIRITSGGVIENFSPISNPFSFKKQVNEAVEGSFSNTGDLRTI